MAKSLPAKLSKMKKEVCFFAVVWCASPRAPRIVVVYMFSIEHSL